MNIIEQNIELNKQQKKSIENGKTPKGKRALTKHLIKDLKKDNLNESFKKREKELKLGKELLELYNGEEELKSVMSSGLLNDDTFFQTIFLQNKGEYIPLVVTSKGDIIFVRNNEIYLIKAGIKKGEIKQEEKYNYFIYENTRYKFMNELYFRDNFKINTVNKEILIKIKSKQYSKDIYDKIVNKVKDYWDHYNKYHYDVIAVCIFETPILRAIGKTFYLIPQGKEDTGKSTLQKIIAKLQFNGLFGGKGTVALNVRLAHFLGCNIGQDELDKCSKDEKKVFTGVANSGLYSDGTYSLIDTNKKSLKDQITILHTFSKKTFSTNNLYGFDNTFLSRCYTLISTGQGRKLKDINLLSEQEKEEFQNLRNDVLVYCLFNWNKIKQSIKEVKRELEEEGVFGRKTDMNSIILGIVKHFKEDYYKNVKNHLQEKEWLQEEEKSTTQESLTFEFLTNKFIDEDKVIEISNKEIASFIAEELNLSEEDQKGLSRKVGWTFKNYDLVRKKENIKRGSKGERKYVIEKNVFLNMLRRFKYPSLLEKLEQEPMLRNGKNGKNGRLSTVSEVSEVSEHRFSIEKIQVSDDDLVTFVKEKGKYDVMEFSKKYGEENMNRLLKEGKLYENPSGVLRSL
tara:strand:+ start:1202 stop:3079 length:1878 start_codon:yes stop_codon:yes gene_type:complete